MIAPVTVATAGCAGHIASAGLVSKRIPPGKTCVIVGAGNAAQVLARDLVQAPELGLRPLGLVGEELESSVHFRLPVLGNFGELEQVLRHAAPDVVIIAMPNLRAEQVQVLAAAARRAGAEVRHLPSLATAIERDFRARHLRRMVLSRLLGREEVNVVGEGSQGMVAGKRVLVTGAGGSIGSELSRQLRAFQPEALYLLDHDESNLHRLQLDSTGEALLDTDELIVADIRDSGRMRQVLRDLHPQIIFHAAAHKHLPLLERHPCEAVKSNVLGTKNLVTAAIEAGTERFVLISTDKAADPISVLGATKRIAELVLQSYSGLGTKLASVRFGNVLGSRGSFLAVLSRQFEDGGDITVTHPEVTRFFMTIEEAAGLVIEAASMAEDGQTFVLDMGEPVRILDLVYSYADQLHIPQKSVKIRYTGLRPGEKMAEALFSGDEERRRTKHPKIWAAKPAARLSAFGFRLDCLLRAAAENQPREVQKRLRDILPGYMLPAGETAVLDFSYPDDY